MHETGMETKYTFLTIPHNITDALRSLSFTAWLSSDSTRPIRLGKAKALPLPPLRDAQGAGGRPGRAAHSEDVLQTPSEHSLLRVSPECVWGHRRNWCEIPISPQETEAQSQTSNSVSSHQIKHKVTPMLLTGAGGPGAGPAE